MSATETKHTPGPWETGENHNGRPSWIFTTSGKIVADCEFTDDETDAATGAFIVRACNSHEALVEALEAAESKLVQVRSALADHGIAISCTDEITKAQDALIMARS